jgi:hypothetical protein
MSKNIRLFLKIGGIVFLLGAITVIILRYITKAHSPEDTTVFSQDGLKLEVFYNRPFKKEREIFGNLVSFNEVWRTGANEATTFETYQDILVDGSLLKRGKYTLWTIPMKNSWKVMFNSKMYPWGINLEKEAYRDPRFDDLVLERPVESFEPGMEQFTIQFERSGEFVNMTLAWDTTGVIIPIKKKRCN